MSLVFRLVSRHRQIGTRLLNENKSGLLSFVRPVTLKASPIVPESDEGHDERNMRLKRPLSPHLTIYSPQLTSMLSITHRMTGLALSAYAISLGLGAVVLPESIPHYIDALESAKLGSGMIWMIKYSLALPLTYHFWNGIRHLSWDSGRFLTIKEVYLTGYVMLLLAFSSAIALSSM